MGNRQRAGNATGVQTVIAAGIVGAAWWLVWPLGPLSTLHERGVYPYIPDTWNDQEALWLYVISYIPWVVFGLGYGLLVGLMAESLIRYIRRGSSSS